MSKLIEILKKLEKKYSSTWVFLGFSNRSLKSTEYGICNCFYYFGEYAEAARNIDNLMHELETTYFLIHNHKPLHEYWYPRGQIKPRLKLIRETIKRLQYEESIINDNDDHLLYW